MFIGREFNNMYSNLATNAVVFSPMKSNNVILMLAFPEQKMEIGIPLNPSKSIEQYSPLGSRVTIFADVIFSC
ncbi:MAG: hypothetical protein B6U94_05515 [Thermofilum sp. ex4484_79]|nr:MAG: hypothetical protein B6U94_05515 [Thermofilum sp. ex4484_79]